MPQVVGGLQAQPQPRTVAAELAEPHGHLGRDRHLAGQDAVKRLTAHAQFLRRLDDTQVQCGQHVVAQNLARMDRRDLRGFGHQILFLFRHDAHLSVILLKVNPRRIALGKLEGDPPGTVHVDRIPLRRSVERVKPEARIAQIPQRLRLIQGSQDAPRPPLKVRPYPGA